MDNGAEENNLGEETEVASGGTVEVEEDNVLDGEEEEELVDDDEDDDEEEDDEKNEGNFESEEVGFGEEGDEESESGMQLPQSSLPSGSILTLGLSLVSWMWQDEHLQHLRCQSLSNRYTRSTVLGGLPHAWQLTVLTMPLGLSELSFRREVMLCSSAVLAVVGEGGGLLFFSCEGVAGLEKLSEPEGRTSLGLEEGRGGSMRTKSRGT